MELKDTIILLNFLIYKVDFKFLSPRFSFEKSIGVSEGRRLVRRVEEARLHYIRFQIPGSRFHPCTHISQAQHAYAMLVVIRAAWQGHSYDFQQEFLLLFGFLFG
jgi:hypothetical protein